jgi:tryptophanyl-tRNA synthetase
MFLGFAPYFQDGTSKMSKSAENDGSRINLTDTPQVIADKIKRCKTDTFDDIAWGPDRPEASNLLTLYQLATGRTIKVGRVLGISGYVD